MNIERYARYTDSIVACLLHAFLTSFFMAWSLSADGYGPEIAASKLLHPVVLILCSHWISSMHACSYLVDGSAGRPRTRAPPDSSPFPPPVASVATTGFGDEVHLRGDVARRRDEPRHRAEEEEEPSPERLEEVKRKHAALCTAKIVVGLSILVAVDLVFLGARLAPIGVTCYSHWNTGEKIPAECGGRLAISGRGDPGDASTEGEVDARSGSGHLSLYVITLALAVLHPALSVAIAVVVCRRVRPA
jgi:hypothetical protein